MTEFLIIFHFANDASEYMKITVDTEWSLDEPIQDTIDKAMVELIEDIVGSDAGYEVYIDHVLEIRQPLLRSELREMIDSGEGKKVTTEFYNHQELCSFYEKRGVE